MSGIDISVVLTCLITGLITVRSFQNLRRAEIRGGEGNYVLERRADALSRLAITISLTVAIVPIFRNSIDDFKPFLSLYISCVALALFAISISYVLLLKAKLKAKPVGLWSFVLFLVYAIYLWWSFELEMFNKPKTDWTQLAFNPETPLQYFNTYFLYLFLLAPLVVAVRYYSKVYKHEINLVIRLSLLCLNISLVLMLIFLVLRLTTTVGKQFGIPFTIIQQISSLEEVVGLLTALFTAGYVFNKTVVAWIGAVVSLQKIRKVERLVSTFVPTVQGPRLSLLRSWKHPNYLAVQTYIQILDCIPSLSRHTSPKARDISIALTHIQDKPFEQALIELANLAKKQ